MKSAWLKSAVAWAALVMSSAILAQAPAPTPAPAAPAAKDAAPVATATAAADAVKAPPALPPGSTAAPGWNVPPKWSDVEMKGQYASVQGRETNVLVEDSGLWWRTMRNQTITKYGAILLTAVPALLILFYLVVGPLKLKDSLSGRLIERFNSAERMTHWTMAISFLALALSGLVILYGKHFLLPVLGASLFSGITELLKNMHNFVGPLFLFTIVVFFFMFVKDNFFESHDFTWLAKGGGMVGKAHVEAGRFNGGEKVWFWLAIVALGLVSGVSGLIMLFPNWNSTRELMAEANIVHAVAGLLFLAGTLAHIYIGTVGTPGALDGMRTGYVDETWAREHHGLWYNEVKSGKVSGGAAVGAAQPTGSDD